MRGRKTPVPSKDGSRLRFTEAELDGGSLKEHDRASEREADRAELREDAPPKDRKKLKRRIVEKKSGADGQRSSKTAANSTKKSGAGGQKKGQTAANSAEKSGADGPKKGKPDPAPKATVTAGHLQFEENRPKPPSKLSHAVKEAPVMALTAHLHREVSKAEAEDGNVGVESVHRLEQTAEGGVHLAQHSSRAHQLREYRAAERSEINALYRQSLRDDPELGSNPMSRWQQKQRIKKEYAAAKRSGQAADGAARGASTLMERVSDTLKGAADKGKQAGAFIMRHKKGALVIIGLFAVVMLILNIMSSCSVLAEAIFGSSTGTTYPSADADMLGAEADYAALEAALQDEANNYASYHPGYNEYNFTLDSVGHDPYVLISILSAYYQRAWTRSEVQSMLQTLFDRQYSLTQTVETETRYYTYTYTDDDGEHELEAPYTYYICNVKLENFGLSPTYILNTGQQNVYDLYMATLGNRPDLFPTS